MSEPQDVLDKFRDYMQTVVITNELLEIEASLEKYVAAAVTPPGDTDE